MNIVNKKVSDLIPYERNTKKHDKTQISNVAESIRQYGFVQPVVIDKDNVIVIGHCRVLAAKKLRRKEVPCVLVDDLTPEQVKALRIVDNKTNESDWDLEFLAEELDQIDLSDFDFDFDLGDDAEEEKPEVEHVSLFERFGVPPFSILDTRQGYWQDRKKKWKDLGLESQEGRKEALLSEGLKNLGEKYCGGGVALGGTSIFDPVLCELMYRWFCTDHGRIYDCFAGGSVRGVIASYLGYDYTGIDLRKEQIEANEAAAERIGVYPKWFCDDSQNADKYVPDDSCDMIFSCPPYADLEVYSNDPRDISNMDYEGFCKVYHNIIDIACRKLKENRFAVFVVGEVRDKKGFYRNFVEYTKKCFADNGLLQYNEFILLEQIGTGAIRANKAFNSGRKIIKTHQNVLVFYKGDPKTIKNIYKEIYLGNDENEIPEKDQTELYWIILFLYEQMKAAAANAKTEN